MYSAVVRFGVIITGVGLGLLAATFLLSESVTRGALLGVQNRISVLLQPKQLSIEGTSLLSDDEVLNAVPVSSTIFSWLFLRGSIEEQLQRHPLVADAVISPCSGGLLQQLRCFAIRIVERTPKYVAVIDSKPWLVGEDGGFIGIADDSHLIERMHDNGLAIEEMSLLTGLSVAGSTPDHTRGRLNYVRTAVEKIGAVTNLQVQSADLKANGELRLRFEEIPVPVIFGFAEADYRLLAVQAERLKVILSEIRERFNEIELIDLAFRRVGVVRFKSGTPAPDSMGDVSKRNAR